MKQLSILVVLLLVGCTSPTGWLNKVKSVVTTPRGKVEQSGPVAVPAQSNITTTKTDVPIPPGSTITITTPSTPPKDLKFEPVVLSTVTTTESAVGATSFVPPAPPTPSENAAGAITLYAWFGLIAGAAVGVFGLVRGWNMVMYGGGAVAAACAIALFIKAYPWLFIIIGVGVAIAVVGPTIWHTQIKPLESPKPISPESATGKQPPL